MKIQSKIMALLICFLSLAGTAHSTPIEQRVANQKVSEQAQGATALSTEAAETPVKKKKRKKPMLSVPEVCILGSFGIALYMYARQDHNLRMHDAYELEQAGLIPPIKTA